SVGTAGRARTPLSAGRRNGPPFLPSDGGTAMSISEFQDAYEDPDHHRGAILQTPISGLSLRAPILVNVADTVADAVDAMNEHHTGCVLVGRDGKLAGIFTERDVLKHVVFRNDDPTQPVEELMTADPETLEADATLA